MTEPVYMTIQIEVPSHVLDDVELMTAFGSVIKTMRNSGQTKRFDDACVVRCARHLVDAFSSAPENTET